MILNILICKKSLGVLFGILNICVFGNGCVGINEFGKKVLKNILY